MRPAASLAQADERHCQPPRRFQADARSTLPAPLRSQRTVQRLLSRGIHKVRNGFNRSRMTAVDTAQSSDCRSCADIGGSDPDVSGCHDSSARKARAEGPSLGVLREWCGVEQQLPFTEIPRADSSTTSPADATTGFSTARRRLDMYRDRGNRAQLQGLRKARPGRTQPGWRFGQWW